MILINPFFIDNLFIQTYVGSNGFIEMKGSKDYLSQLSSPKLIVHILVHVFSKMVFFLEMGVVGKRLSRYISNISVNFYVHKIKQKLDSLQK